MLIITASIFVCVTLGALGLYWLMFRPPSAATERLRSMGETGGNLAEILEKVGQTIRERFRILEDLKTLTTSSRLSAWILCGIPIFVALAVTAINGEYMSVLWYDPRGHKLIFAASVMQLSGMLVVRKILQIKI